MRDHLELVVNIYIYIYIYILYIWNIYIYIYGIYIYIWNIYIYMESPHITSNNCDRVCVCVKIACKTPLEPVQ